MRKNEIKRIIEALLFASPEPLSQKKINEIFTPNTPNLKRFIEKLNNQYTKEDHSFEIKSIAGGFQLVSKPEYEIYIRRMLNKSGKISLSVAAMDCLAIIAYKQPITRLEIEHIRGVDSSGVVKNLLDKGLIIIKGRDEGLGRALLYTTTALFLEIFGLDSLKDLPTLDELTELMEEGNHSTSIQDENK